MWAGATRLLAVLDGDGALAQRFVYADARMPMSVETTHSGERYDGPRSTGPTEVGQLMGWLVFGAAVALVGGLGLRFVFHPDREIPGYTWGPLPPPARTRALGWVLIVAAGLLAGMPLFVWLIGHL